MKNNFFATLKPQKKKKRRSFSLSEGVGELSFGMEAEIKINKYKDESKDEFTQGACTDAFFYVCYIMLIFFFFYIYSWSKSAIHKLG